MSAASDEDLVRAFRPEARIFSRHHPRTGATQYQVRCDPVPGKAVKPIAWVGTETHAWRAACANMGLRVRQTPLP